MRAQCPAGTGRPLCARTAAGVTVGLRGAGPSRCSRRSRHDCHARPFCTPRRGASRSPDRSVAGLLLLIAGSAVALGITTAEALYPADYIVHRNTISDLAAMRPEDIVRQPSAAIFNTTMIVAGGLIVIATVLLYRSRAGLPATFPVAGSGIGMIGMGLFPGNTVMAVHQLVSIATFLCGGVAAILTARLSSRVLRPVLVILGGIALAFLVGYTVLG